MVVMGTAEGTAGEKSTDIQYKFFHFSGPEKQDHRKPEEICEIKTRVSSEKRAALMLRGREGTFSRLLKKNVIPVLGRTGVRSSLFHFQNFPGSCKFYSP